MTFKNKKLTPDGAKVGWLSKPKCEWMPRNLFRAWCSRGRIKYSIGPDRQKENKKEVKKMALCPFSWTIQKKGCIFTKDVWEPVECLGSRCKLWDASANDCGLLTKR